MQAELWEVQNEKCRIKVDSLYCCKIMLLFIRNYYKKEIGTENDFPETYRVQYIPLPANGKYTVNFFIGFWISVFTYTFFKVILLIKNNSSRSSRNGNKCTSVLRLSPQCILATAELALSGSHRFLFIFNGLGYIRSIAKPKYM